MHSINAAGLSFSGSNLNGISTVSIRAPTGVNFRLHNDLIVQEGKAIRGTGDVNLLALANAVAALVLTPAITSITFLNNQTAQIVANNILASQDHTELRYLAIEYDGGLTIPTKEELTNTLALSSSTPATLTIPSLAAGTYVVHYYIKSLATTKETNINATSTITVV